MKAADTVLNQKHVFVLIAVHTAVGMKSKTSRISSSRCQNHVLDVVKGAAASVVNGAANPSRNGKGSRGALNERR